MYSVSRSDINVKALFINTLTVYTTSDSSTQKLALSLAVWDKDDSLCTKRLGIMI